MSDTKMSHADWIAAARDRYGDRSRDWKFICPACKTVQTGVDFLDAGLTPEEAATVLGFSCIGRYRSNPKKAFGDGGGDGRSGCDYTTGGLLNISPVSVELPDMTIQCFDFADRPLVDGEAGQVTAAEGGAS